MSVTMMVSKAKFDELKAAGADVYESNYSGHELYMHRTHHGHVLSTYEKNGYDDSDFCAVVWDDAKGEPCHVMYATTRGWTYPNGAAADATPEVRAKYDAWEAARAKAAAEAAALKAAKTPSWGKVVKVVRGRKVPIGTVAEVFWTGPDKFSRSYYGAPPKMRVGLRLADGSKVFTAASNLEVVLEGAAAAA